MFLTLGKNGISQCNNVNPYGGGVAPTLGGSLTMSTCNFATEYATVTGVAASTNYQVTSSIASDFITIRQGTSGGPVIASGFQPLNWTSTVAGNYYVHINTNAACGTNTTCRTTTLIASCTAPANPNFGINTWNVLGYNHTGYNYANLAALTGQTFRGYYTDATVDINSQARWNTNNSPSSATPYTGCPVTFDNHTVVYKRQGFPVAQYQIDLNGHDDGVQCYVNGVLVYQIDGCCADRGIIWTGALCSTSTVEFRVMEGGGGSNLAVDFIETPWTVNAGADGTTVCAIQLNGTSSSSTFVWSPAGTLSSSSVLNPIATPAATTTYTLSSTMNGCTISDDVLITKTPFAITGATSSCIGATTDLNAPEAEWVALPTGGTVTTIGNERIHRFTASGTFNTSQAISNARVLVVAGGGGGGHRHAGGGGAGGVLINNSMTIPSGAIATTVGNGGNGATAGVYGLNGGNSIFNGLTAIGGGYGSSNGQVAGIGGSGGGGSNNLLGQLGTAGQGNRGGNQGCSASYTVSGCGGACGGCYPYGSGGGGAGAQGGDSPGAGSAGGIGISNNITGAAVFYGGGGGGGLDGVIAAGLGYAGGNGGGGAGGSNTTLQGVNGTANTGGGGGGGGASGGASGNGGNGGSGVVIVRYTIPTWTSSVPGVATVNPLTGVVTAVSAGTTVITYTSPNGCSTTLNFTVNPANTVAAGINRTTCINTAIATINLATTVATGATVTGLPAGVTGTWAGNVVTISGTPTASGIFNYTVTTTGGCPPATTTGTITVNTLSVAPTTITGTTTICNGGNTTLTLSGGTAGTGASAQWYSGSCGGTFIGTGNSINVSPATTTTYFVRYSGTCNTTTCASVTVTVNSLSVAPTSITGITTICVGSSTTLTLSGGTAGTGATAQWYSGSCGGTFIGTGNSINVSPATTTTYFVRYSGTCNTTTCASVTVTVNSLSVAPTSITGITTICVGSSTTLTLSGGSAGTGATAQWYSGSCGGTFIGNGNSINVSPIANTTYFVRYSGTCNTTTCASVAVTVNTLSVAPTSITGTTAICAGGSTTLTLSGGTAGTGATAQWYSGSCGGTLVGTGNSVSVSPATTTTYFVRYSGTCNTTTCASVIVTVNTISTTPTITPIAGTVCPNTNTTLNAGGGTAGTGSTINWYTGPNGTGTFLGSGSSIVVAPAANTTYYARREGTCNTTSDASVTLNVKNFVYALNGTTSNTYCTDNAGWHHFYSGDEIIFSVQGDLTGAPVGYPLATINDNGTFYQETEGPGTAPGCASNQNPGEERFEMERSWNLDFGGGAQSGTYNIRFYYQPAERTAIENAAIAWMATYPSCGYGYKYPNPLGFYWFKNTGSNYTAPDYDGTQYAATVASVSGVNYAQWTGIPNFSGGSGAIILEPITTLPVELSSFAAICNESGEEVTVRWATASEHNSSHFTVDRSFDGIDWEILGTVDAAGNSTSNLNYELTDSDARGRAVVYYRLNQFDYDGASKTYGPSSAACLNDQLGFEVFPNPAGTDVTVLLHGEHQTGETEVIFTDVNGKEVNRIIYNEQTGKLMTVDLRNLEPGVYLVRLITSDTNDQFVRLIKQ